MRCSMMNSIGPQQQSVPPSPISQAKQPIIRLDKNLVYINNVAHQVKILNGNSVDGEVIQEEDILKDVVNLLVDLGLQDTKDFHGLTINPDSYKLSKEKDGKEFSGDVKDKVQTVFGRIIDYGKPREIFISTSQKSQINQRESDLLDHQAGEGKEIELNASSSNNRNEKQTEAQDAEKKEEVITNEATATIIKKAEEEKKEFKNENPSETEDAGSSRGKYQGEIPPTVQHTQTANNEVKKEENELSTNTAADVVETHDAQNDSHLIEGQSKETTEENTTANREEISEVTVEKRVDIIKQVKLKETAESQKKLKDVTDQKNVTKEDFQKFDDWVSKLKDFANVEDLKKVLADNNYLKLQLVRNFNVLQNNKTTDSPKLVMIDFPNTEQGELLDKFSSFLISSFKTGATESQGEAEDTSSQF